MRARGDGDFWQSSESLKPKVMQRNKAFDGDHPQFARRNHLRR